MKLIPLTETEQKRIMLDILLFFDEFCKKFNLTYSLSAGTLLGAIRHRGFIPWDDDIDVMMPRRDYQMFKKKFPRWSRKNGSNYKLLSEYTHNYFNFYSKIIDSNTLVIEKSREERIGVWIDVMPVDFVIKENDIGSYGFIKDHIKKIRKFGKKFPYIKLSFKNPIRFVKIIGNNLILFLKRRFLKNVRKCWHISRINKYIKRHSGNENMCFYLNFVIDIWFSMPNINVYEVCEVEFENNNFYCISQWDKYLKVHYGNYLKIPSIEEREVHEKLLVCKKLK